MPLSSKQMEYLALAWQCFENEPKIDYEKFKTIAGLASAHSARELMRVTKKKLKEEYGAMSGSMKEANANGGNSTPATPKTTTPRKRATPGTGKKSTAKKSALYVAASENDDDDEEVVGDEETPVKKKARKDSTSPVKSAGKGVKVEDVTEEGKEFFF